MASTLLSSQVEFTADSLHLRLVQLAKDGNNLMTVVGDIDFRCRSVHPVLGATFSSRDSYLVSVCLETSYKSSVICQSYNFIFVLEVS